MTGVQALRMAAASLALLGLPACALVRSSNNDFGPEQFQFTVAAVNQVGPEADAVVRDLTSGPGDRLVEGSAEVVATVESPEGRVRFVEYQTTGPQGLNDCEAVVAPRSASAGCGPAGAQAPDPEPITLSGVAGSNGWSSAAFRVSVDVFEVVAVATDGTTYRIAPGGGIGYVMWKNSHGRLSLTASNAAGESLGQTTLETAGS